MIRCVSDTKLFFIWRVLLVECMSNVGFMIEFREKQSELFIVIWKLAKALFL